MVYELNTSSHRHKSSGYLKDRCSFLKRSVRRLGRTPLAHNGTYGSEYPGARESKQVYIPTFDKFL
jgi:hypothetical protein